MCSLGPSSMTLQSATIAKPKVADGHEQQNQAKDRFGGDGGFQMPLHYPWYKKADYETMLEWRVDCLLREYGLTVAGDLGRKRRFAMGAFLWPDQY